MREVRRSDHYSHLTLVFLLLGIDDFGTPNRLLFVQIASIQYLCCFLSQVFTRCNTRESIQSQSTTGNFKYDQQSIRGRSSVPKSKPRLSSPRTNSMACKTVTTSQIGFGYHKFVTPLTKACSIESSSNYGKPDVRSA